MSDFRLTAEPGKQEIVITAVFDAPRDIVFKASTEPNLMPEWWGPRRLTTTVERMDLRPGGSWRIIQRDPEGHEHAFHGVYHDVSPPERTIRTFEYEGMPGHPSLETCTFEETDGRTVMTERSIFLSLEDRDGAVGSGMEGGVRESMERLSELVRRLQTGRRQAA